jgi:hypothetical protein
MTLQHVGDIPLTPHQTPGGFDHAAVHRSTSLSAGHTANDAVEVIDCERDLYMIAFDSVRNKVYAFLPQSCRPAVYVDSP